MSPEPAFYGRLRRVPWLSSDPVLFTGSLNELAEPVSVPSPAGLGSHHLISKRRSRALPYL